MSSFLLAYMPIDSPIHRLNAVTKLIFFVVWSLVAMITFDTRILAVMLTIGCVIFAISRVPFRNVAIPVYLILIFLFLNNVAIFLFSPQEGVEIYGSRTEWLHLVGRYTLTWEQMFYQMNVTLKYLTVLPMALLFLVTTHPSEFASSLARIGVNYRIGYALAIALRYIPDIQRDYRHIAFAQQTRGLDLSRKEKLGTRIKNAISIVWPLILSSLERIEKISAAMELRGFGSQKKRTFYNSRPLATGDYIALALLAVLTFVALYVTFHDGSRFYNPFQ